MALFIFPFMTGKVNVPYTVVYNDCDGRRNK